jgi:hypothetical protein
MILVLEHGEKSENHTHGYGDLDASVGSLPKRILPPPG